MEPSWHDPFDEEPDQDLWVVIPMILIVGFAAGVMYSPSFREWVIDIIVTTLTIVFGIVVIIGLVWCIIEIRKIKKVQQQAAQVELARQAELKDAYRRVMNAHWAMWPINPQASARFHQIIAQHGFKHPDVAITVDRVRQLAADVKVCRQEWPHDEELYQLGLRVAVLAASVSKYESAVRAFQNRDLAKAWRLVNRLPGPDPDNPGKITFLQFIYLWGVISREFYTAMMPEFTTGQISPYLLDALGIEIPGQLLYELQSAYHSGRPPSQQLLAQVEHLRERVLKANQTLPKWGDWFPLLGPQTLAILDRGTEGFIHYLLAVALERPFKE